MTATSATSGRGSRLRTQAGFTLLEVMLAFAILAMITGAVTVSWSQNMDKATNAVIQRELREVADTVFRRILYEIQEHQDGQTGSLEEFYGEWTGFRGLAKEKWAFYSYELLKKEKVAAGMKDTNSDAESLFGDDDDDEGDSGSSGSSGNENAAVSIVLLEVTLHIRELDSGGSGEPLITLRTYIRPPDLGDN